jgi:hypothetical protein
VRVGRGNGPRGPKKSGPAEKTGKAGKASFQAAVDAIKNVDSVDPDEARSKLAEAWQAIAEELRDGGIEDRREAIRRVVSEVIRDRFKGLKGQGVKTVEAQVAKVLEDDPRMAAQLEDQFRRLAGGNK